MLSNHTSRSVKPGVMHTVLNRLEEKGWVKSELLKELCEIPEVMALSRSLMTTRQETPGAAI